MRRLLIVAALIGLSACATPAAPREGYADSGWRTRSGAPLSLGEVAALRETCVPRRMVTPIDTGQPTPNPLRDNPVYHPGGEGLASAPPSGIAAIDQPVEPGTRRGPLPGAEPVADCLMSKGLVRAP